jgi:hypothetical protein
VNQTNHFFNLGYGWLCKHCSAEDADMKQHPHPMHAGEHHSPSLPLAKWTDVTRKSLQCPRCGIEEMVSKA